MKQELWLFIAEKKCPGTPLIAASLAWLAEESGVLLDSYWESERDGMLFAESGSTVVGGRHFQDFNYLCCRADVKIIRYGDTCVFDSSIREFGLDVIADASDPAELYRQLFQHLEKAPHAGSIFLASCDALTFPDGRGVTVLPYLFPEVAYRKALFFPVNDAEQALTFVRTETEVLTVYRTDAELDSLRKLFPDVKQIDTKQDEDTWGTLTLRIAERWKQQAKSVFFGDPAALACRIPSEYRRKSIAVFAPPVRMNARDIQVSGYTEMRSALADETAKLALEVGNPVICGRQTLDGDIIHWSKYGVSIQIVDPNRPAFPVIQEFPQVWLSSGKGVSMEEDIPDEQLLEWAREGKVLTTLLWHSGEIAHNEAMINLIECAALNRVKMGIGVHAQRYETCPQLWELIRMPEKAGGAAEYIEPVLHSGGLGVMAECHFPSERLGENIRQALSRIEKITGKDGVPRGYYAFLDTDLSTHMSYRPEIWSAVAQENLEYFISSVCPGRNRILAEVGSSIVLNQSCRVLESSSPFVRISEAVDILQRGSAMAPGWMIATLDAPVVAFNPYIWEKGYKFMEIMNAVRTGGMKVNVKPSVIARYARILKRNGYLPETGPLSVPRN